MRIQLCVLPLVFALHLGQARAELRIPAFTAYIEPDPEGLHVSPRSGITGWNDPALKVLWVGEIKAPGRLNCSVSLTLPAGTEFKFRLSVAGKTSEATAKGQGSEPMTIRFDPVEIASPGYYRFTLESLAAKPAPAVNLEALILDGPAAKDAHFNLKPRRNAASVHLFYPLTGQTNVEAFYCEVQPIDDPIWTFYMACGWHRGYFGMQVNSPEERRIIFSVWDSGNEASDRDKVQAENRVTLVAKGDGVHSGDFGNEGTGGHSHLKYQWKTDQRQRFIVTAKPVDPTHTIYSGYYFRPDQRSWMMISSWKAPKDGGYLRGLHSFSENFGGDNGHLRRKALFGDQWIRTADGKWSELITASFSCDETGRQDRLDRFMGVETGQFFLSHGGFVEGFTRFGEKFHRPPTGKAPNDLQLPPLSR